MKLDNLGAFPRLMRAIGISRRNNSDASSAATETVRGQGSNSAAISTAPAALRSRLRTRLASLGGASPQRRCAVFVETVLASELSENAGLDPQFAAIVARVADELMADPNVSGTLDQLLSELSTHNN